MNVTFLGGKVKYASEALKSYEDALEFLEDEDLKEIQDSLKNPKKTMATVARLISTINSSRKPGSRFRSDCTGHASLLWAALNRLKCSGYRVCIGVAIPKEHYDMVKNMEKRGKMPLPNHVWVEYQNQIYEVTKLSIHIYLEGYFDDLDNYHSVKEKIRRE